MVTLSCINMIIHLWGVVVVMYVLGNVNMIIIRYMYDTY